MAMGVNYFLLTYYFITIYMIYVISFDYFGINFKHAIVKYFN